MSHQVDETLFFQRCATLQGETQTVQVGRRNGRRVAFLKPDWTLGEAETSPEPDPNRIANLRRELSIDLNPLERRTWLQLLDGRSIGDIAHSEGRTRTAIYERIRGNGKSRAGMVGKNPYVALWWCQRQKGH
jgi:hypothetical protein